ncbi:MAG TPA: hypothetical protein VIZ30_04205, partial [Pseudomonadales bacterium]
MLLGLVALWTAPANAIPPNTPITNTASATYRIAGADYSATTSRTIVTSPSSGNSPPAGVGVAPGQVDENFAGATVGVVSVIDSDPSDSFTFSISDPRFEIVGGQLQLIAGTALDFEAEPTVALTIVATDSSGASVTVNLVITVVDINEAPTALALSRNTVDANVDGAPVGALTASDPDAGDSFTYAVDDPRFEVVGGTLKLIGGENLPLGTTVTVTVTVTDSGGLALAQTFVITATPPGSGAGVAASLRFLEFAGGVAGAEAIDVGATQCSASANPSGPFQNVGPPTGLDGLPIGVPGTVELRATPAFKTGAPVFVEVNDADANVDPLSRETVVVSLTTGSGVAEILRLTEDGVDSGRFVGYANSSSGATNHDCALGGGLNVTLSGNYVDAADANDTAQARAAFDPISRVFLAGTGAPISGVSIELVDTNGVPANVFGDDGVSAYPSTVTVGVDTADASGAQYVHGPGDYRFPLVAGGTYQLRVTPSHRFGYPSNAADGALQALPGAPYTLSGASRGALFTLAGGAMRVDVPLDLLPVTPTAAALEVFALANGGGGVTNRYIGATQCANGSAFVTAPAPVSWTGPVTVPGAVALHESGAFGGGEPVFIVLTDPDQDLDPFAADTVRVTAVAGAADTQTLILTETGASTGVFSGYLQLSRAAPAGDDCALGVAAGAQFGVEYRDAHDSADGARVSAVVDPGSRVVNSATSDLIDGVAITLLDAVTGEPATNAVFADDGVTPFPTTVVSGDGATDESGLHVDFAAGTFRFPVIAAGTYRFRVTAPGHYTFPSTVSDARVQTLTGAPFVLGPGSRGADFDVVGTQPLQLDVPLDPVEVDVFVTKQANKEVAAIGDFVQYNVIMQNADAAGIVTNG